MRQGGREGVDSEIAMIGVWLGVSAMQIPIQNLITLNTFRIWQGVPPRAYSREGKKDPGLKSGETGARAP